MINKQQIITLEIHRSFNDFGGEPHEHFNFRITKVKEISDRQRINFLHTMDNNCGNTSLEFLLDEIAMKLKNEICLKS
jgi:hypothetical protein